MDLQDIRVCQVMEGTAGGSRKHVLYITRALREAGATVDLILSPLRSDPDFPEDLDLYERLGCHVELVAMHRALGPWDVGSYRRIRCILAARRPHVVHTHCAKAGLLGRLAARSVGGIGVVHTPHSFFLRGFRNPLARAAGVALERWLGRRTDLLFCISPAERELAANHRLLPAERIEVAPNGLPADFRSGLMRRQNARTALGLAPETFAIGVFARLVAKKGHFWLLEAMAKLPRVERERLRLFIFGHGDLKPPIARRIRELGLAECVRGPVYEAHAERYLPAMDLGILPSFYEGLSYQLLETLGAGVPLIATNVPGNAIDLPANPIVYVEPLDCEGLAARISDLEENPARRTELGARGPAWVAEHFALVDQVARLAAAYRRVRSTQADPAPEEPIRQDRK